MEVSVGRAKKIFSSLLKRAAAGEDVVITKWGKPVARIEPVYTWANGRLLGSAKGEFVIPDDFNDPLPKEIEDLFWK